MAIDNTKPAVNTRKQLSPVTEESQSFKNRVKTILDFSANDKNKFANFIKKEEIWAAFAKIRQEKIFEESRIDVDRAISDIKNVLDLLDVKDDYSEFVRKILIPYAKLAKWNYDSKINDSFTTYTKVLKILWIQWISKDDLEELSNM